MASLNKVQLIGNCGRDPELRYLNSGMAVCNVSIATSSRRKDKQTGEYVEETQWHRVQFFDRLAEIAGEYLTKGKPAYIEGKIKYGKYTDKDGIERNTCDIVAESLQLLGGREHGETFDAEKQRERNGTSAPAPRQSAQTPTQPQRQAPAPSGGGFDDIDDDIPF